MVTKLLHPQALLVWGQAGDHGWEGLREAEYAMDSGQNRSGRRKKE